jgi:hypothetical protein
MEIERFTLQERAKKWVHIIQYLKKEAFDVKKLHTADFRPINEFAL